jgi:hypothetical protein
MVICPVARRQFSRGQCGDYASRHTGRRSLAVELDPGELLHEPGSAELRGIRPV